MTRRVDDIDPGTAIDRATIIRRKRMALVAGRRAEHANRFAAAWPEGSVRKAWRDAERTFPGDDGVRDELSAAMLDPVP